MKGKSASGVLLVKGYHEETYSPVDAYEAGLRHRFAVVLGSFRPGDDSMVFDEDLFIAIVERCLSVIKHDSVSIEITEERHVDSFSEMFGYLKSIPEDDREPPLRMTLLKNGSHVCIEETEFWVHSGGPDPYHDSYTLSFYTSDDMSKALEEACRAACEGYGTSVSGVAQGPFTERKPFKRWWKRLLTS